MGDFIESQIKLYEFLKSICAMIFTKGPNGVYIYHVNSKRIVCVRKKRIYKRTNYTHYYDQCIIRLSLLAHQSGILL